MGRTGREVVSEKWPLGSGAAVRIAMHDWSATPLGAPATWPPALRLQVQAVLDNPFPMALLGGRGDVVVAYNEAYEGLLGGKPEALGRPFCEVWAEVRALLEPLLERARAGEACRFENARFVVQRGGAPEEAFFEYAFSPVRDADGSVVGILNTAVETTARVRGEAALARSRAEEERQRAFLETLLDTAAAAIAVVQGPELRFVRVNKAYLALRPGSAMTGRAFSEVFPEADGPAALLRRVIETGERETGRDFHVPMPGCPDARWDFQMARLPCLRPDEPPSALVLTWDTTVHWRSRRELERSQARFRSFADGLPIVVWVHDAHGSHDFVNSEFERFFGFGMQADVDWRDVLHPEDRDAYVAEFLARVGTREPFRADARVRRADGAWRWIESWGVPRFDAEGAFEGYIGASADMTERVEAERHRRLLTAELDHRVKNTLAVVQGIAHQTFRDANVDRATLEAFKGRLQTLASAHDLLTRESWAHADLGAVAAKALAFGGIDRRVSARGPAVMLTPKQAVTVAMALHELLTNALKHGALSRPEGFVKLAWDVRSRGGEERLSVVWREEGGPPVSPPTRRGFGLRLIERALATDLCAQITLAFESGGFVCRIEGRLPHAAEDAHGVVAAAPADSRAREDRGVQATSWTTRST